MEGDRPLLCIVFHTFFIEFSKLLMGCQIYDDKFIGKNKKMTVPFIQFIVIFNKRLHNIIYKVCAKRTGLSRDLNPGPPAPKAGIIPLDHWATHVDARYFMQFIDGEGKLISRWREGKRSCTIGLMTSYTSFFRVRERCTTKHRRSRVCPFTMPKGSRFEDEKKKEIVFREKLVPRSIYIYISV